jgi:type I restriction enzyme S subunit
MYGATAGVSAITEIEAAINQAVLAVIPLDTNHEYLFFW